MTIRIGIYNDNSDDVTWPRSAVIPKAQYNEFVAFIENLAALPPPDDAKRAALRARSKLIAAKFEMETADFYRNFLATDMHMGNDAWEWWIVFLETM